MSLPSDNPVLDARGLALPADGSILNQVGLAVAPLGDLLSRHAPLHGMFGAGALTWLVAVLQTAALTVAGALAASSPMWERVDRPRWGRRLSVLRAGRRPR